MNTKTIQRELDWLASYLDIRLKKYFLAEGHLELDATINMPPLKRESGSYATFLLDLNLSDIERAAFVIVLAASVKRELLDVMCTKNTILDKPFTQFGGKYLRDIGGVFPTGEMILFVLCGDDLEARMKLEILLFEESVLFKNRILRMGEREHGDPFLTGTVVISQDYLSIIKFGKKSRLDFHADFPAKQIFTHLEWSDLILEENVMSQIEEIILWTEWNDEVPMNDWKRLRTRPGYRALFYGPPGTGKTLTASLLGKVTGRDVFKVDLSMVVSKYIGETEKNLSSIFQRAETEKWVLFFDEGDALFGKRSSANSSNDRYANQETAYLLQRIEDFGGLIILATNLKVNMDDAFSRRFQSSIHFAMPTGAERLKLWAMTFGEYYSQLNKKFWTKVSEDYIISGGAIVNVFMNSLLQMKRHQRGLKEEDVLNGIRRELLKEGKISK
jgi:hypothetical protein